MSWLFSRALVEEYSEAGSLGGEPCAQLNVMPTQRQFWRNDKPMDVLSRSPFGLTWKPLMDTRGEALLTLYRAAFPARTFHVPEKEPELKALKADSGNKWRELLVKYDRDTHSWKTHQCLWVEDLPWFSVILPKWGMMRDGVLSEHTTPAPLTSGTEYGSWRTPMACDWKNMDCSDQVYLQDQVKSWPTPRAANPGSRPNGKGEKILEEEARKSAMWPTPAARDYKDSPGMAMTGTNPDGSERNRIDQLARAVYHGGTKTPQTWPTPSVTTTGGPTGLGGGTGNKQTLKAMGCAKMATAMLSAYWTEWLMGWPIAQTDLKPLGMDKFQQWLDSHGKHSGPTEDSPTPSTQPPLGIG